MNVMRQIAPSHPGSLLPGGSLCLSERDAPRSRSRRISALLTLSKGSLYALANLGLQRDQLLFPRTRLPLALWRESGSPALHARSAPTSRARSPRYNDPVLSAQPVGQHWRCF